VEWCMSEEGDRCMLDIRCAEGLLSTSAAGLSASGVQLDPLARDTIHTVVEHYTQ